MSMISVVKDGAATCRRLQIIHVFMCDLRGLLAMGIIRYVLQYVALTARS